MMQMTQTTATCDGIWLVIGEEGEYSDYSARIKGAWLTEDAAMKQRDLLDGQIKIYNQARAAWDAERNRLWNEIRPGRYKFFDFVSEAKEREWKRAEAGLDDPGMLNFDRVQVMFVPVGVPCDCWIVS